MVIYVVETFLTIKCVLYANCIYKLSKLSGKYNRDIIEKEYQKCLNDCIVFKVLDKINEMLDRVLSFKAEPQKFKNKFVEFKLCLLAHKGSGFGFDVVLINLPQWRSVVNLIKNGTAMVFFKIFNGYVDQVKKILNMFILDLAHYILEIFIKNIGKKL